MKSWKVIFELNWDANKHVSVMVLANTEKKAIKMAESTVRKAYNTNCTVLVSIKEVNRMESDDK